MNTCSSLTAAAQADVRIQIIQISETAKQNIIEKILHIYEITHYTLILIMCQHFPVTNRLTNLLLEFKDMHMAR